MVKSLNLNNDTNRAVLGIIVCFILLLVGYFLLKFVSVLENPPLGQTTNIVLGTSFISLGSLGVVVIVKHLYTIKKRKKSKALKRRKNKIIFFNKRVSS